MHSHSYMYIYERPIENISLTLGINSANLCTLALPSDNSHVTSPREGVQPLSSRVGGWWRPCSCWLSAFWSSTPGTAFRNHPILQCNFPNVLFSFSNPLKLYHLGSHLVAKSMFDSAAPWTVPMRLLCPWDSPVKNTGVGSHSLLQRILPIQRLNPGLLLLATEFFTTEPPGKPLYSLTVATAAKSLQSCPTLCDPIDGSPPGSAVPGILQARTLEWVAISFSNEGKWNCSVVSDSSRPHGLQPTRVLLYSLSCFQI